MCGVVVASSVVGPVLSQEWLHSREAPDGSVDRSTKGGVSRQDNTSKPFKVEYRRKL